MNIFYYFVWNQRKIESDKRINEKEHERPRKKEHETNPGKRDLMITISVHV